MRLTGRDPPSPPSDVVDACDPRILDLVRMYCAVAIPLVCRKCDGAGSVTNRERNPGFWYVASSTPLVCDRCEGEGITFYKP